MAYQANPRDAKLFRVVFRPINYRQPNLLCPGKRLNFPANHPDLTINSHNNLTTALSTKLYRCKILP
ncbi:hypothetical protein DSO57_1017151 [Entomophthora muscae]|uniref:Uncharacterized protein n=1 Tax=Entomophthora muscae TaxID=34485 RepID=A0ACC2S6T3_9FUNG|nr:hypothetical protein DSO57_1017151 [Entomophthora muscae]